MDEIEKVLTGYWLENYLSTSGICSLCANSGVIHTKGIITEKGWPVGRDNFCICPNGRAMREES